MSDLVTPTLNLEKNSQKVLVPPGEGYGQNPLMAAETPNVRVIGIGASTAEAEKMFD